MDRLQSLAEWSSNTVGHTIQKFPEINSRFTAREFSIARNCSTFNDVALFANPTASGFPELGCYGDFGQ